MKYQRLYDRGQYCMEKYRETGESKFIEEEYCVTHVFECSTLNTYSIIADFAKEKGFNNVYDIGCAYGHQSEVFLQKGVNYVGVEASYIPEFWNSDKFKFIKGEYPLKIQAEDNDLVISVLCLTWNCYLYEKEKTLTEQCEALQRDFKHCVLYLAKDKLDFVKKYFKNCEKIDDGMYYFYN